MSESLVSLIPEAAGHELLGPGAFYAGTPTAASADQISLIDLALVDGSGAKTWRDYWLYVYQDAAGQSGLAGSARLVEDVTLSSGKLSIDPNRPFSRAPQGGDLYWLLRTFSRNDWRDFANRALRQMKRRVVVTAPGLGSSTFRYAAPAGIVRPEDVYDVAYRSLPEVAADGAPMLLRWFGWEANDGALTLLVSDAISTAQELVFDVLQPYAAAGQNVFTADTDTTTAPRDWLVAEMVARALLSLWSGANSADDRANLGARLQAAGRLVAGFRAHYVPAPERRALALEPRF